MFICFLITDFVRKAPFSPIFSEVPRPQSYLNRGFVNSLPKKEILDWSRLKAFADDKINMAEKLNFVLERAENIAGKGENAVTSIFSFSHNVFKSLLQGH